MSVQFRACPVAIGRHGRSLRRGAAALAAVALAAGLSACVATPSALLGGVDPSDPSSPVPTTGYRSTLGSYVSQRPVEPGSWREQNERVAPSSSNH